MRLRNTLICALVLFSAGMCCSCASVSKASEDESNKAKNFVAPADRGSVYLYRTGRAVAAAVAFNVQVNGMDAGGTGPGSFFKWDLKPGVYTFLSSTNESSATVRLNVEAGKTYFIRQDARMGVDAGRVAMKEVDASKGKNEISGCKLLVSSYIPE